MNFEELLSQIESEDDMDDDAPANLDINVIRNNIDTYDVKKLCEMVVCDRYFSLNREISVICMQELSKRREAGDTFDFENYIESSYKDLPVLHLGTTDLRSVLGQMIIGKIK